MIGLFKNTIAILWKVSPSVCFRRPLTGSISWLLSGRLSRWSSSCHSPSVLCKHFNVMFDLSTLTIENNKKNCVFQTRKYKTSQRSSWISCRKKWWSEPHGIKVTVLLSDCFLSITVRVWDTTEQSVNEQKLFQPLQISYLRSTAPCRVNLVTLVLVRTLCTSSDTGITRISCLSKQNKITLEFNQVRLS